jgi:SAM-dependent methyltransferase
MGFEHIPCNYCGSQAHIKLFDIQESPDERQPPGWRGSATIPVVRCHECGLIFLNPRYDDARLTALYQDPQMFTGTIDPEGRSRSIVSERAERVARFKQDVLALRRFRTSGRLLDIGCGLGFFLEALGNEFDATGLEWSAPAVKLVHDLPFKILEGRFPERPFDPGEFDIVAFNNVLDHLPDPLGALIESRRLLKTGGLLMLSLVNIQSLAARIYENGFRLLAPNHLYYFSPEMLRRFLAKAGFQLMKIQFPYLGLDFAQPLKHTEIIVRDWWRKQILGDKSLRLSPPYYGNMMRVFAASL